MLGFALIDKDVVINLIVGDSLESVSVLGNCVEILEGTDVGIGYIWDGNNFINPNPIITEEV
jgi:hypothetical protein